MPDLIPCPFCGSGRLKLDYKATTAGYNGLDMKVRHYTYSVRCNVCHARGGAVGGKVIEGFNQYVNPIIGHPLALPEWAMTRDALKEKAVELWNRRALHK